MTKLTDHDVIGILLAVLAGRSQDWLAEVFEVEQSTIAHTVSGSSNREVPGAHELRLKIWERRTRKSHVRVTDEMRGEIYDRYHAGETNIALAAEFDLATATVFKITGPRRSRRSAA